MIQQPTAIIFLDGEEFMRIFDDRYCEMFDETMRQEPDCSEYALMVWKPKYGVYLREQLVMRGAAR